MATVKKGTDINGEVGIDIQTSTTKRVPKTEYLNILENEKEHLEKEIIRNQNQLDGVNTRITEVKAIKQ